MTYPLTHAGPVISQGLQYNFVEQTDYSPAVPIAVTANNFLFKGTASGMVAVLDSKYKYCPAIQIGTSQYRADPTFLIVKHYQGKIMSFGVLRGVLCY